MIVIVAFMTLMVLMPLMALMPMVVTTRRIVLRGKQLRRYLNSVFSADGAHMVSAAVQAFHVAEAIASAEYFARGCPLDAYFFAAFRALSGGWEQRFGLDHEISFRVRQLRPCVLGARGGFLSGARMG